MRGKKIAAFLLAFATAAAVIPAVPAKAADYSTVEMETTIQGPTEETDSYYKFTMEESGRINITVNYPNDRDSYIYEVKLYEADGEITGDYLAGKFLQRGTNVMAWDLLKGEYYFTVNAGKNYSFTLTPEYSNSTFEESMDEENYNENTAKKVDFKKDVKGALSMNEIDGDFYKVKVGSKGTITATVSTKVSDAQMVVYKMGQTPQTFSIVGGKSVNKVKLDSKGTYYVIIRKGQDTGNYSLNLKFKAVKKKK